MALVGGAALAAVVAVPHLSRPDATYATGPGDVPATGARVVLEDALVRGAPPLEAGPSSALSWAYLRLVNPTDAPYQGRLVLQEPLSGALEVLRLSSDGRARPQEILRSHRLWTAAIDLAPREAATLWVGAETPRGRLPVELWTRAAFADGAARTDWTFGLLFGVIVAITLYSLLSAMLADRSWRPITAFLAVASTLTYVNLGYAHAHWGHLAPELTRTRWPLHLLGVAALSAFGRHFLNLGRDMPRAAVAARTLEAGLALCALGVFFGVQVPTTYTRLVVVAVAGLSLVLGINRAIRGTRQALLYVLGWLPPAALAVFGVLVGGGRIPAGQQSEAYYLLAVVGSVFVFAFAVAERVADERRERAQALLESEERYAYAARGTNDGLFDWDMARAEVFLAPRLYETLGLAPGSLGQDPRRCLDVLVPEDKAAVERKIRCAIEDPAAESVQLEARVRQADEGRWFVLRALVIRDEARRAVRLVGSVADNHHRKLNELELARRAFSDDVTGLPNRARVAQHLQTLFDVRAEQPELSFAVLFVDLDRFKNVNDSLGHMVGDELLATLGRRLSLVAREEDMVGRLGGDEFVLVAAGRVGVADAERIGQRILEVFEAPVLLEGIEVRTSASIGIAHSDANYASVEEILSDADLAMYEAKHDGKGRCVTFRAQLREQAMVRLEMEADLRQAIERGELEMYYQPIMRAANEALAGFEALIRWHHPKRGLVSPATFIPLAEETGLIRTIGRFALHAAATQLVRWRAMTPSVPDLFVTVNVSPAQFGHALADEVRSVLRKTGLPPATLRLEITENLFVGESGVVQAEVEQICALGVSFSLDDFGTGYSSLSYLHRLPFRALKIDRSFMQNLLDDPQSEAIVRSVLALARALGMETVAEGVETAQVADRLRTLGTGYLQGYYFARPRPPEEIEAEQLMSRSA